MTRGSLVLTVIVFLLFDLKLFLVVPVEVLRPDTTQKQS
jgi:hypothetical protein